MSRLIPLPTLSAFAACAGSSTDTSDGTETDGADDVLEVAIRRLNEGQGVAYFEGARGAFVAQSLGGFISTAVR